MARDDSIGAYIIGALILLYLIVQFFKQLLPYALGGMIVAFIAAIVLSFTDVDDDITLVAWGCFAIFLILSSVSWVIGYGIEQNPTGKALVDTGEQLYESKKAIDNAEDTVKDAMKNATITTIESVQNQTTSETKPVLEVTKTLVKLS